MAMFQTEAGAPADSTEVEAALERMILLRVGEHRFAVPIERVREIIPGRPCTPLPGSDPCVRGLINLRGRIVTVIDLGTRLNLEAAAADPEHGIAVMEHAGRVVGLAVGGVDGIVSVDPASLDDSGETLRSLRIDRTYLRGLGEADDRLFVAVDPDEILDPLFA